MIEPDLDEILEHMVEHTVMFLTNDLPSLLDQDRVALIRRVHKDEILKNIPEAKQAINQYALSLVREVLGEVEPLNNHGATLTEREKRLYDRNELRKEALQRALELIGNHGG